MGNSASGLPYDEAPSEPVTCPGTYWALREGFKKQSDPQEERFPVTLFRCDKLAPGAAALIPLAQRNWQKLRTIRHPYIISFLDGIEMEKELVVVTESVTPLHVWLQQRASSSDASLVEEVVWGFKCLLEALNFIHLNCGAVHTYLGPHSIYIGRNGDWKLGGLDLVCSLPDEEAFFRTNEARLDNKFRAPERREGTWTNAFGAATRAVTTSAAASSGGKASNPFGAMDVYSLGAVLQDVFDRCTNLAAPPAVSQLVEKMTRVDCRKRLTCAQALRSEAFTSGGMALMGALSELAIKQPMESLDLLQGMRDKIAIITRPISTFKILPAVARALNTSVNDYQNRDSREACRQMIQVCVSLVGDLCAADRADEAGLVQSGCAAAYVALWPLADRVVRTELLRTLKPISSAISADTINKKIFDNLLTGFNDSNAKMREDTLKNLVCIVDKLEERNLQEKTVRFMSNLQGDAEPSIRTNATIFIGRVAPSLKEPIRLRVLPVAFVKAMKDGFAHCRLAGARAALACTELVDVPQLLSKIMPQACLLLLDQHPDVRQVALDLVQACTVVARDYNTKTTAAQEEHMRKMKAQAAQQPQGSGSQSGYSGQQLSPTAAGSGGEDGGAGGGQLLSSITSWAVDGLSKKLESAVIGGSATGQAPAKASINAQGASAPSINNSSSYSGAQPSSVSAGPSSSIRGIGADSDSFGADDTSAGGGGGWGDEDLDFDFDEGESSPKPAKPFVAPSGGATVGTLGASKPAASSSSSAAGGSMKLKGITQPVKAAASNGWDDDDWMDELAEEKPAATLGTLRKPTATTTSSSSAAPVPTSTGGGAVGTLGGLKKPVPAPTPLTTTSSTGALPTASAKATKSIGAKKLVVDKTSDNWDDF